jgi:ABC-type Fe3+/spermidine/putrescine transport system ATPase subunit
LLQDPDDYLFNTSVREDLEYGPAQLGLAREAATRRVDRLAAELGLTELLDRPPFRLSGGEKQRAAVAAVFAFDPDVLLLDEPLGSLDYVLQKRLRRELSDLNEELDMTFIYVTHSLEAALIMSDRIFVLDQGELIQSGRPVDIYRRPTNRFVAEFMGDANLFTIDSAARTNGTVEITGPAFDSPLALRLDDDVQPDYIVVRYDDAYVAPELVRDVGVEVTVYNKLVKGNRTLVETTSEHTEDEYIAEMDYDEAAELAPGDSVYFQWNERDSMVVPE